MRMSTDTPRENLTLTEADLPAYRPIDGHGVGAVARSTGAPGGLPEAAATSASQAASGRR